MDYSEMRYDELVSLLVRVKSQPPCDNDAPGTCCDRCNVSLIREELDMRLQWSGGAVGV